MQDITEEAYGVGTDSEKKADLDFKDVKSHLIPLSLKKKP